MGATSTPQPLSSVGGLGGYLTVALAYSEPGRFPLCVCFLFPPSRFTGLPLLGKQWLTPALKEPVIWASENDAYIKLS